MKVVIAGSSGLVGTALTVSLARDGHTVVRLIRAGSRAKKENGKSSGEYQQLDGRRSANRNAGQIVAVAWNPNTCDLEGEPFGEDQKNIEGADALLIDGVGLTGKCPPRGPQVGHVPQPDPTPGQPDRRCAAVRSRAVPGPVAPRVLRRSRPFPPVPARLCRRPRRRARARGPPADLRGCRLVKHPARHRAGRSP